MKHPKSYILTVLLLLSVFGTVEAQNHTHDPVKKIEVFGSAEKEITPDEIFFSITLKEYLDDDKQKVSIDNLERKLYSAIRKIGIEEEDFQIENVFGYNYDWQWRDKKKEREDFFAQKQYRVKFSKLDKINRLFAYLDPKGIQRANVSGYSHSRIEAYRRELKIEAMRNARDKATYLLDGIDESRGEVLEVQEVDQNTPPPVYYQSRGMAMAESTDMAQMQSPEIDFKKIKLSSQVRVVFRIE
jgi:uncharacterized protein